MKLLSDFNGYESLYVCGDIHDEFKTLAYEIKHKGITDAVILVAGDCGIGFEKPAYYEQLYRRLEKNLQTVSCMLLLVRGNHDDPEYFQKKLIDFPLMKAVPDYSVVQFASKNIICVGGGVSVDRSERLAAMLDTTLKGRKDVKYYWGDEMPVFDRPALTELTANNILIDSVVTHTSPSFCQPIDKSGIGSWLSRDKKLEEDLYRERAVMDELYNYLLQNGHPLTDWFYGHFHTSHTEYISAICFRMLDIMELRELKTK